MHGGLRVALYVGVFVGLLCLAWWGWSEWYPAHLDNLSSLMTIDDSKKTEALGLYGDSFGAFNALITALAFSALVATLILQVVELGLQRKEMVAQQSEMKAQRQEMSRQVALMEHQLRLAAARDKPFFIVAASSYVIEQRQLTVSVVNMGEHIAGIEVVAVGKQEFEGTIHLEDFEHRFWPNQKSNNLVISSNNSLTDARILLRMRYTTMTKEVVDQHFAIVTRPTSEGPQVEFEEA